METTSHPTDDAINASANESKADKRTVPLIRLLPGLVIGPASWLGPYIASSSLFMPALFASLDEDN